MSEEVPVSIVEKRAALDALNRGMEFMGSFDPDLARDAAVELAGNFRWVFSELPQDVSGFIVESNRDKVVIPREKMQGCPYQKPKDRETVNWTWGQVYSYHYQPL